MSEIEKMYENIGIEPKRCSECDNKNIDCGLSKDCYPPFTAEKQIKLIKWLVHYIKRINITNAISGEFYFTAFGCIGDMKIEFEEALASLVNNLWQGLTEEDKQQIKEILE